MGRKVVFYHARNSSKLSHLHDSGLGLDDDIVHHCLGSLVRRTLEWGLLRPAHRVVAIGIGPVPTSGYLCPLRVKSRPLT